MHSKTTGHQTFSCVQTKKEHRRAQRDTQPKTPKLAAWDGPCLHGLHHRRPAFDWAHRTRAHRIVSKWQSCTRNSPHSPPPHSGCQSSRERRARPPGRPQQRPVGGAGPPPGHRRPAHGQPRPAVRRRGVRRVRAGQQLAEGGLPQDGVDRRQPGQGGGTGGGAAGSGPRSGPSPGVWALAKKK